MHLIRQSRNRAEQEEILKVHRLVCLVLSEQLLRRDEGNCFAHRSERGPSKVVCHSARVKREAWSSCSMR